MLVVGDGGVCLVRAYVRGHALALMEDLDGCPRGVHFHDLPSQLIGQAVEALVEFDMVVDVDGGLGPREQFEVFDRRSP